MEKHINILIKENTYGSYEDTLRNFTSSIEYVINLDTGRLTLQEQNILNIVGQTQMIILYSEAIKKFVINNQ